MACRDKRVFEPSLIPRPLPLVNGRPNKASFPRPFFATLDANREFLQWKAGKAFLIKKNMCPVRSASLRTPRGAAFEAAYCGARDGNAPKGGAAAEDAMDTSVPSPPPSPPAGGVGGVRGASGTPAAKVVRTA